jgi:hypothetical protein
MYLIIENLPADTQATEVSMWLAEKGFTDYTEIKVVEDRIGVAIIHCNLSHAALSAVAHYLDQTCWHKHVLSVSCTHIFSE